MKFYLIVSLLISMAILGQSQNYCQGCVDANLDYLCNGKMCEGFTFNSNTTSPVITGIQCALQAPCYVLDHYDTPTQTFYFVACNYTMGHCVSCQ